MRLTLRTLLLSFGSLLLGLGCLLLRGRSPELPAAQHQQTRRQTRQRPAAAAAFSVEHFDRKKPSNLDLDWRKLSWRIRSSRSSSLKLLVLMRHGQALHNLGPIKFGWDRWLAKEALTYEVRGCGHVFVEP